MRTWNVKVGSMGTDRSGRTHGAYREVEFEAVKLGEVSFLTGGDDTRGVEQILFETDDGRLVVYEYYWSKWQGESDTRQFFAVDESDLEPRGRFWRLGKACDMSRPLTLEEALEEGDA